MVVGHVLPDKETSLVEAYEKCRALADPKVCCDYALHVGITWWAPKVTVLMVPPHTHLKKAPEGWCPNWCVTELAGA